VYIQHHIAYLSILPIYWLPFLSEMSHKKYFQMGGVVFGAFVLYILIKKNPANAQNILEV